jgi:SAM-dependent methyltransferase
MRGGRHEQHYTGVAEYDSFAGDYDVWAADMTEDVAWYVELAREAYEPVVELGIGSGRVAIPIARETGKRVIGIDRSPAMMAVGRDRATGLDVEFREGDTLGVLSLWWLTRSECEGLLDVSGLEVEALFGGFHREPYDDESLEMVWLARRP